MTNDDVDRAPAPSPSDVPAESKLEDGWSWEDHGVLSDGSIVLSLADAKTLVVDRPESDDREAKIPLSMIWALVGPLRRLEIESGVDACRWCGGHPGVDDPERGRVDAETRAREYHVWKYRVRALTQHLIAVVGLDVVKKYHAFNDESRAALDHIADETGNGEAYRNTPEALPREFEAVVAEVAKLKRDLAAEQSLRRRAERLLLKEQDLRDPGAWHWLGGGQDELASMGEAMVVRIMAGDLRRLITPDLRSPAVPQDDLRCAQLLAVGSVLCGDDKGETNDHPRWTPALDQARALVRELAEARAALGAPAVPRDEADQMRDLLRRCIKYAREDRMVTPGVTRLARALSEAESLLRSARDATSPAPAPSPEGGSSPECEGWSARWCPMCGDCKCSEEQWKRGEYDRTCALHGDDSQHAAATHPCFLGGRVCGADPRDRCRDCPFGGVAGR